MDEDSNDPNKPDEAPPSLASEFVDFLKHNKIWWLSPILIATCLLLAAAALLPSQVAPFIYSLL